MHHHISCDDHTPFLYPEKDGRVQSQQSEACQRSTIADFFSLMLPVSKRQRSNLLETVEFLKDPKQFARLGGKMPTGVLLVGPLGAGSGR